MKKIGILGASGFVGSHLVKKLSEKFEVISFTRQSNQKLNANCRQIDLFSRDSVLSALKGVDIAIYLVHSMLPTSRLFQGDFHDVDIILADNFAWACEQQNVKQIIYLGGIEPTNSTSKHLKSRLDVEEIFHNSSVPATAFRAGMVVGAGGSSFEILRSLVSKLPGMILPKWTQNTTQAVYIKDVVDVIAFAIENPAFLKRSINLVNGEVLTYEDLLKQTAAHYKKKVVMKRVSINSTQFSKLWVQIFSSQSRELVSPLIDSLVCEMPRINPDSLIEPLINYKSYSSMLKALDAEPHIKLKKKKKTKITRDTVTSIQALNTKPISAQDLARDYFFWLMTYLPWFINVSYELITDQVDINLKFFNVPLLILKKNTSTGNEVQSYGIIGGVLARKNQSGFLEFRFINKTQSAYSMIHGYEPSLPWYLYFYTQAKAHLFVMNSFSKYLRLRQNQ